MRAFLFAALVLLLPIPAFSASSFSTDVSDLWWNPNEPGWGVNFIQQSDTLFATLFVYGPDGRARWYVASDLRTPGAPSDQPYHFRGTLYETYRPRFLGRVQRRGGDAPRGRRRPLRVLPT